MLRYISRTVYLVSGTLFVALAILGIALPLLPTTPFLLLAAFCFSKSSKTLHSWLLASPLLGGIISDWESSGIIRRKTKIVATVLILAMVSYPLIFVLQHGLVKVVVLLVVIAILGFIWSRPSHA